MPKISLDKPRSNVTKKSFAELSYEEECAFSGLPMATCSHCTGDSEDSAATEDDDWEIIRLFTATSSGQCNLMPDHRIKRGDIIGKLQHSGNPFVSVPGWCCRACAKSYPIVRN